VQLARCRCVALLGLSPQSRYDGAVVRLDTSLAASNSSTYGSRSARPQKLLPDGVPGTRGYWVASLALRVAQMAVPQLLLGTG
jgi:hypothetical protein